MSSILLFLLSILSFLLSSCSVRPSTMTEDYRVPDGMVGLSEYTREPFHTHVRLHMLTYTYAHSRLQLHTLSRAVVLNPVLREPLSCMF